MLFRKARHHSVRACDISRSGRLGGWSGLLTELSRVYGYSLLGANEFRTCFCMCKAIMFRMHLPFKMPKAFIVKYLFRKFARRGTQFLHLFVSFSNQCYSSRIRHAHCGQLKIAPLIYSIRTFPYLIYPFTVSAGHVSPLCQDIYTSCFGQTIHFLP